MHKPELIRGLVKKRIQLCQSSIADGSLLDYEEKRVIEEIELLESILNDIDDGALYPVDGGCNE